MKDDLGAFRLKLDIPGSSSSGAPLNGLRFAVKDVIDVGGVTTGGGNPDWLRTHEPADRNAVVVDALLAAGASLTGITFADELAFGLSGENVHYGTPVNPAAPDAIPGGSSSGSAVAVAGSLVDFALGTDTAGSVRVPASYCGIFGMRPTWGSVPVEGVMALTPSCDTVGWMARDSATLERVGRVLLGPAERAASAAHGISRVIVLEDAMELADPRYRPAFESVLQRIRERSGEPGREYLTGDHYAQWLSNFNRIRAPEIWSVFGDWITRTAPRFGPQVAGRFESVRGAAEAEVDDARAYREEVASKVADLLRDDTVLVLPTVPGPAPLKGLNDREADRIRQATLRLTSIAPMCRVPQVSIPATRVDAGPLGLSLIGPPHADAVLLHWVREFWKD